MGGKWWLILFLFLPVVFACPDDLLVSPLPSEIAPHGAYSLQITNTGCRDIRLIEVGFAFMGESNVSLEQAINVTPRRIIGLPVRSSVNVSFDLHPDSVVQKAIDGKTLYVLFDYDGKTSFQKTLIHQPPLVSVQNVPLGSSTLVLLGALLFYLYLRKGRKRKPIVEGFSTRSGAVPPREL